MKPEDYIDENYVPTEDGFALEQVDEKEELRKSIKKGCRLNTIFSIFMAIVFVIDSIVKFDDVSVNKLYLCPMIALMLLFAIYLVFYAIIYDRIRRASTAKEMKQYLLLLGTDTLFAKLMLVIMALCIIVAAVLGADRQVSVVCDCADRPWNHSFDCRDVVVAREIRQRERP